MRRTKLTAAGVVGTLAVVIVAAALLANSFTTPTKSGIPAAISLQTKSAGDNYTVYFGLQDQRGNFVSSSGNLSFTVVDSRGRELYSYDKNINENDFKTFRINGGGDSLRYAFNFSKSDLGAGVPLLNGSGIAKASFTRPDGTSLRKSAASIVIRALPKISVTSVNLSKVGSVGAFVTISLSPSNFTAYSGDLQEENLSLFFFNVGDEGMPLIDILGIDCIFSANTTGFGLVSVLLPGTKLNTSEVFLPSNARIPVLLVIKTPDRAYSGPLVIQVSLEPAS